MAVSNRVWSCTTLLAIVANMSALRGVSPDLTVRRGGERSRESAVEGAVEDPWPRHGRLDAV